MIKLLFIFFSPFLFLVSGTQNQVLEFDNNEPQTTIKQIKRSDGQLYNIIITLPSGYQPEKEYKILYYLDAYWLQDLVEGSYRIKYLNNKSLSISIDDVILVGISSVGNEYDWNLQRTMDFTPSKYKFNLEMTFGGVSLNDSTTGGAEDFMQFVKNQIITSVESEHKVDASSRGIMGHSFGGLLAFYSFLKHSELFSNYILIAPSVWWNTSEILQNKEAIVSKREVNMFIAVGTSEISLMNQPLADLVNELNLEKNQSINLTFKQYENATHNSVLPQSIYDGIEFLYSNK